MPYPWEDPYRIKQTDNSTTVPGRLTFPVGTYVNPSTAVDGQFGQPYGAAALLKSATSFMQNPFPAIGGAIKSAFYQNINAPVPNTPQVQGPPAPGTQNVLFPYAPSSAQNTLVPYPNQGFQTPQTSDYGPLGTPGPSNVGVSQAMIRTVGIIRQTMDTTGTIDTDALQQLSTITGANIMDLKNKLVSSGFVFDPISGKYTNPNPAGANGNYNPYTHRIGKDYYRYLGNGQFQAKPGEAGNRSGGAIRNWKGTLINSKKRKSNHGNRGGNNGGASWSRGEGNVEYRGATG